MNVLVTGAGGGISQGVIKSLKMIKDMDIRIVAADISELATGLYAADAAYAALAGQLVFRSFLNFSGVPVPIYSYRYIDIS